MVDRADFAERFRHKDRRALARLLTWLESEEPRAEALLEDLSAGAGRAHVIGLTGPPGVGKSTLVGALASAFRKEGREVGVICVDPSSSLSGGALLGDRVRMGAVAGDEKVYVRSLASHGESGGLSVSAWNAVLALEAFGFEVVLVETVGSGQGEIEVVNLADSVVLVGAPGLGDMIQFLKAGIMELADLYVLNMADRPGSEETAAQLEAALALRPQGAWIPRVLLTTAPTGRGVPELLEALLEHRRYLEQSGAGEERRRRRFAEHVRLLVWREIRKMIEARLHSAAVDPVERGPFSSARSILASLSEGRIGEGCESPRG